MNGTPHVSREKSRKKRLEKVLIWIEKQLNKLADGDDVLKDELAVARKLKRRQRLLRFKEWADDQLRKMTEKDYLTAGEISKRDRVVQKLLNVAYLRKLGIRANHITIFGLVLVTAYNVLMGLGFTAYALLSGVIGVISDLVDGPVARWKNPETGGDDVTGTGTLLDHTRDFYYVVSIGWDAFFRFGDASATDITNAVLVFLSYFIIMTAAIIKYELVSLNQISPFIRRYSRARLKNAYRRITDFSLMNLQTKLWGRAQFVSLAAGVTILFAGKFYGIDFLIRFSYDFFGATVAFGLINLIQDYVTEEKNEQR